MSDNGQGTLEQQLEQWKKRTDVVSQALLKLHDLPLYRQLAATPSQDPDILRLLSIAQQLYEQFDLLLQVITQAQQYYQQSQRLWGSGSDLKLAIALLSEASVALILGSSTPDSSPRVTPEIAFNGIRCQYQIVVNELAQREPRQAQQAQALHQAFVQTGQSWTQLETLYASALAAQQEAQRKIFFLDEGEGEGEGAGPPSLPEPAELLSLKGVLDQLAQSRDRLEAQALLRRLNQWQGQCQKLAGAIAPALTFYNTRLNRRQELRGRLNALLAKAQAKGKIEHPELSRLAQASQQLLYHHPIALNRAEAVIQQYEQRLNQAICETWV